MNLDKFPSIKYPAEVDEIYDGISAVITEKYDGANMRFTVTEDDQILCGSRNVVFKENGEPQDIDRVNKQFRHSVEYLQQNVDIEAFNELFDEEDDVTVFGESLHKHAIDYDAWDGKHPDIHNNIPNFIVFDIMVNGEFMKYEKVEEIGRKLGLNTAKKVAKTDNFQLDEVDIPQSEYRSHDPSADLEFNQKGLAEGVVVRNTKTGDRAKIVHEEFSEVKRSDQTEPKHDKETYTQIEEYVNKYVTKPRVEKQAYTLIDEGGYDSLQMSMMDELHKVVYNDVLDEAEEDIQTELSEDELETFHKQLANKTATLLQKILQS